ncbi:MAG TPA: helix-turn-helix transcriptional regulator [Actinophytocola sp.]|uniref:helix-turn-helix domain-containing protein n=1 Tax=Actinophytocola sp. TaxID=1872138 RepID=UPI002DB9184E|nr:helix-turn-helix transcriptional regulator [Actinophytocola sp.]HEU5470716.1 helix-turn-helix transcriptional regulator [Actinophytocola sp.]
MQVTFGPQVARRVLRYELDRLCEQAGKTHTQAGERLGVSRVGFTHLVSGKNLPSRPALEILLDFFGRPDRIPMMLELLTVAKLKPDQQSTVRQDIESSSSLNDFELAVGLEAVANGIEVFDPMVVNGLLQTEAYARELIAYHASITLGVDIEVSVALRMRRQSVITREESPAELWWVVEEQALHRPVGDSAVMAAQFDHLLDMTSRPNINVQVIPRDVGVHPALSGAFFLLRFDDDWRVAYEETRRSAYYYDAPDAVEDYGKVMNHLRHLALNPKRSRALFAKLRKEVQ